MSRKTVHLGVVLMAFVMSAVSEGSSLEKLEAIASRASTLADFLSRPELLKAYRQELEAYTGGTRFRCQSFDEIILELTRLNGQVPLFGERLWEKQGVSSVIHVAEFSSSRKERTPGTPWNIRPVARAFHGIWVDPSQQGCVAPKSCEQADMAAPRRWAMGLRGAKMFLVEKGNRFQGSAIVLLPLRGKGGRWNLVVASGSSQVQRRGYFRVGRGAIKRASLLGIWQKSYQDPFPMAELAYLPNNPKVAHLVALESNRSVGYLNEFSPGDPMSSLIEEALPRECHRASLQDLGWNVFAGFDGQNAEGPTSTGTPSLTFNSGDQVKNFLLNIDPYSPDALAGVPESSLSQLQEGLEDALNSPDPKVRENAAVTINLLRKKKRPREVAGQTSTGSPSTAPSVEKFPKAPSFTPALRKALRDPVPNVRDAAARGLADSGDKSPAVNNALSDSIRRPGGPTGPVFPGPGGGGPGSSGGLSPLESARRALDSKLRNGLPVTDRDLERLLDKAKRSNNPRERDAAARTFADAARDPGSRNQARSAFAQRCSGANAPSSAAECRRLQDEINKPQDPTNPGQCKNCPPGITAGKKVESGEDA